MTASAAGARAGQASPATRLNLILALIALAALVLPLLFARHAPVPLPRPTAAGKVVTPRRVVPPTVLPEVEPVQLQDVSPEDARAFNGSVPLVTDGVDPARPYRMLGSPDDVIRATDCLAAAVLYEAGDDAIGEQAVAQVVLNRLHHPAFPKTVCGVVFQGSERATGCQFTFTCDGSIARRLPGEAAWRRAREVAAAALSGFVYRPVGLATHYHTDYVVPYWQSSLDKIAQVHTHLFFRWTGVWGTPLAFRRTPLTAEPPEPQLAVLSDAHRMVIDVGADGVIAATPFFGRAAQPLRGDPNVFITALNPAQASSFAAMAQSACGDRDRCKFMGWTDPEQMPFTSAMAPGQMAAMSFSYLRDRTSNLERTLWNCFEFKRPGAQCMRRGAIRNAPPAVPDVNADTAAAPPGPTDLKGVRRKPSASPSAAPAPAPEPPTLDP